ncbi:hypothetical protein M408DRAFT_63264 [Serendipita vermifera MAFF 305830]|uniref:mitogen-activated protein kinase kinase n=1 Tax=Serendipita vermifera MAFF 305830 TaxID=933852 RepID=A0A0C3BL65_SERVB|nr:hypothetical protein M408DRAFT_63264 [Serendipita vermifera MAFF 305830]
MDTSTNSAGTIGEDQYKSFLIDEQLLGESASGVVYKVKDTRTGNHFVKKILPRTVGPAKSFQHELKYLKEMDHRNIVKFFGAYIQPGGVDIVVLMGFCEGGSLEAVIERIRKINARVSEPVVAKIGEGVFSGLHYLHSKRVTHRGIKPSNILLSRNGMVKLCNFDISGNLQESFASSWTGMDMFLAPERVTGGQYSITADVWSAALSLLTLAQNRSPFPEHLDGMMELAIWIVKGDIPQLMDETVEQNGLEEVKWSDEMKDFISLCLTRDGMRRPKPSEALNHPWLALIALQSVNMAKWMREIRG